MLGPKPTAISEFIPGYYFWIGGAYLWIDPVWMSPPGKAHASLADWRLA